MKSVGQAIKAAAAAKLFTEEIESYRDRTWRREPDLRIEDASQAEKFIDSVGFCAAMTDSRRPGASLYIAVCGRRDAYMPRNVQKDRESNLTWHIKDEVMRRGRIYYAKLARGRATFIAPRLIRHFNAVWGIPRSSERSALSSDALAILKVLRREWEMATSDLRTDSGITDRGRFTHAIDELQRSMKVVPSEVVYEPRFTYIWTLAEGRFSRELSVKTSRTEALKEIARAFLEGAGMTVRGELARVTGLSRPDAGLGNRDLVKEGYAMRLDEGVYLRASDRDSE